MEPSDSLALQNLLDSSKGERAAAEYFKANPAIVYWTFCTPGGHTKYVLNEFRLGAQHVVDMVLLNSYSGTWEVKFVEFEAVDDSVFTKAGRPSRHLASGVKQCDDWADFVQQHLELVRSDLVRRAVRDDVLGYTKSRGEPRNFSNNRLADPKTRIRFQYIVIIGRSSQMSEDVRRLMGRVGDRHRVDVVSYDRLLHVAKERYGPGAESYRDSIWPS